MFRQRAWRWAVLSDAVLDPLLHPGFERSFRSIFVVAELDVRPGSLFLFLGRDLAHYLIDQRLGFGRRGSRLRNACSFSSTASVSAKWKRAAEQSPFSLVDRDLDLAGSRRRLQEHWSSSRRRRFPKTAGLFCFAPNSAIFFSRCARASGGRSPASWCACRSPG